MRMQGIYFSNRFSLGECMKYGLKTHPKKDSAFARAQYDDLMGGEK